MDSWTPLNSILVTGTSGIPIQPRRRLCCQVPRHLSLPTPAFLLPSIQPMCVPFPLFSIPSLKFPSASCLLAEHSLQVPLCLDSLLFQTLPVTTQLIPRWVGECLQWNATDADCSLPSPGPCGILCYFFHCLQPWLPLHWTTCAKHEVGQWLGFLAHIIPGPPSPHFSWPHAFVQSLSPTHVTWPSAKAIPCAPGRWWKIQAHAPHWCSSCPLVWIPLVPCSSWQSTQAWLSVSTPCPWARARPPLLLGSYERACIKVSGTLVLRNLSLTLVLLTRAPASITLPSPQLPLFQKVSRVAGLSILTPFPTHIQWDGQYGDRWGLGVGPTESSASLQDTGCSWLTATCHCRGCLIWTNW